MQKPVLLILLKLIRFYVCQDAVDVFIELACATPPGVEPQDVLTLRSQFRGLFAVPPTIRTT
jgi:hypothetical protein